MKKIFTTAIILSTILVLSCSKTTKLANRLEGTWNIDAHEYSNSGNQTKTDNNTGNFVFKSDGSGLLTTVSSAGNFTNTSVVSFYWNNTGSSITLFMNGGEKHYLVTTNESKKQVWEEVYTTSNSSSSGGSATTTSEVDRLTLSKK